MKLRFTSLKSDQAFIVAGVLIVGYVFALPVQAVVCVVPDSGGTAVLPPGGCDYTTPDTPTPNNDLFISNGFPVGTYIQIDAYLNNYFNIVSGPGGSLLGEKENYLATLNLPMQGHGGLSAYSRFIPVQVTNESHSAPRALNSTPQNFARDMWAMTGQVFGDPDFNILRITAGTANGLPSPGQTRLTRLGPIGSNWEVDSFFDVAYEIEFQGAPGSPLDGYSGTTQGTARFVIGSPIPEPATATMLLLGLSGMVVRRRSARNLIAAE